MKTCPVCGKQYSDNWDTCPNCSGAHGPGGSGSYSGNSYQSSGQYTMKNNTNQSGSGNTGYGSNGFGSNGPGSGGDDLGRAVEDFVDGLVGDIGSHLDDVTSHLNDLGSDLSEMIDSGARRGREQAEYYRQKSRQDREYYRNQRKQARQERKNMRRQNRSYQNQYSYHNNYQYDYRRNAGSQPPYTGKRDLEFYEQSWFIILCFIFCFPAGVALLLLRIYRTERHNQYLNGQKYHLNDQYDRTYGNGPGAGNNAGNAQQGNAYGMGMNGSPSGGENGSGTRNAGSTGSYGNPTSGRTGQVPPVSYHKAYMAMDKGTKTRSIVMIALGVLFGATSTDVDLAVLPATLAISALFLGFGLYPILKHSRRKKQYVMYESLIDNRGNTSLAYVAQQVGQPVKKIRILLQKMIANGFLSEPENQISAYINGRYDMIVVTHRGQPIVPIEETLEKEGIRIDRMDQQETNAAAEGQTESVLVPEEQLIAVIDANIDGMEEDARERAERIRTSMTSIIYMLQEQPDAYGKKNIINMRNKYIPDNIKLIEKYNKPSTSPDMKHQIVGMLDTLARAYGYIETELRSKEEFDFEIDMELMKRMLESDGVLGSDFVIG